MEAGLKAAMMQSVLEKLLSITATMGAEDFEAFSHKAMLTAYQEHRTASVQEDEDEAERWAIRLEAIVRVTENRGGLNKMIKEGDFRWSLTYIAADKKYRLTESWVVDREWFVNRTTWDTLGAAISYMDRTNKERQTPTKH